VLLLLLLLLLLPTGVKYDVGTEVELDSRVVPEPTAGAAAIVPVRNDWQTTNTHKMICK